MRQPSAWLKWWWVKRCRVQNCGWTDLWTSPPAEPNKMFHQLPSRHRYLSINRAPLLRILIFHPSSSRDPVFDASWRVLGSTHCCRVSLYQSPPCPPPFLCCFSARSGPGLSSSRQPPSVNAQLVTALWNWKRQQSIVSFHPHQENSSIVISGDICASGSLFAWTLNRGIWKWIPTLLGLQQCATQRHVKFKFHLQSFNTKSGIELYRKKHKWIDV